MYFNLCVCFLVGIPIGITIGLKTCAVTKGIKYDKKNKEKHDTIVLLVKTNLNNIEVLIYKALTDAYTSMMNLFY